MGLPALTAPLSVTVSMHTGHMLLSTRAMVRSHSQGLRTAAYTCEAVIRGSYALLKTESMQGSHRACGLLHDHSRLLNLEALGMVTAVKALMPVLTSKKAGSRAGGTMRLYTSRRRRLEGGRL